jgi:hypothetical protein
VASEDLRVARIFPRRIDSSKSDGEGRSGRGIFEARMLTGVFERTENSGVRIWATMVVKPGISGEGAVVAG